MTALAQCAGAIARLAPDDLGDDVADAARRRIFDTLGATAVGLATEDGAALQRLSAGLACGEALAPGDVIRVHVAATRCTEIDDINIASCTTVGSVVVPVALVTAASHGIDDRHVLAGIVAGYESLIRLGTAIDGANALYRGVWPTYAAAPFAAAAVTAKLLALDTNQTLNALALALSRTTVLQGRNVPGLTSRWYLLGAAAVDGYVAAHAARAGITADPDILAAFGRSIGVDVDESVLGDGFDAFRGILEVDTKPFPTSRQGMASIQAFRDQLAAADNPDVEAITSVETFVPAQYYAMLTRSAAPSSRLESLVSVAYQLSLVAHDQRGLMDALRAELHRDEPFATFINRVTVHEDPALTERFPEQWGGRVRVRWASGAVSELEVRDPHGSASNPPNWEELAGKLESIARSSGIEGAWDSARIMQLCRDFGRGATDATSSVLLASLAADPSMVEAT